MTKFLKHITFYTKIRKNLLSTQLLQTTKRDIHTSNQTFGADHGDDEVKNFKDFKVANQVTTFEHYRMPQELLDNEYNYPVCRDTMGIKWPGYWFKRKFVHVPEMEPELVVPDLENFDLKPYVSYRTEDVYTEPLTAKGLFDQIYSRKIVEDFENNNLEKYEVTQEEIDEARLKAMQTGADLFEEHPLDGVRAPIEYVKE